MVSCSVWMTALRWQGMQEASLDAGSCAAASQGTPQKLGASRAVSFSEVLARMACRSLDGGACSGTVRTASADLPPPLIPIAGSLGALHLMQACSAQPCPHLHAMNPVLTLVPQATHV